MKHIILGNGPAGVVAAETLRRAAPHDDILLVGNEDAPPYSRMAIPYLLEGNIDESGTYLRKTDGHFDKLHIRQLCARAVAVNAEKKTVLFDDGLFEDFDRLLIATGSHPVRPPIPGIDLPEVHTCWTLADSRAIATLARPGARVLQLGAGFIGCIIMESLLARGVHLSVVEMGDRMVPRMMGPTAGGMIRDWCEAKGIEVFTGTRVESIEPGEPLNVKLSNGTTKQADLVVSAAGVRPAIGFLEHSGITCLLGVLTDEHLQTNVPGVFAAGDCAEAFDKVSGKTIVSAIQPNASEQARIAATNMVAFARGKPAQADLSGVTQINVLDTLGLVSASFGDWQGKPGHDHVELTDKATGRHLSLRFQDDVMVGCNAVGWTEHIGVMRGLVEGQIKLGEWKDKLMQDPTRLVQAYQAAALGQHDWSGGKTGRKR